MLLASVVFAVVLFTAVVRPAVERGGVTELVLLLVAISTVLLIERWLRTR